MKEIILSKLSEIEEQEEVKILFACESGSRAWGFHSTDSDYDVRFIYLRKPSWYLSIEDKRDVIELPVNEVLDINGWDLKKALKLFRSSNSIIFEWLQSPIIYRSAARFAPDLFFHRHQYYSPRSGMHHYLSLAVNSYQELQQPVFKIKKCFYALRPILAACWIARNNECPPMEFKILRTLVDDSNIDKRIDQLLEIKRKMDEKFEVEQDPMLNEFIGQRISFCDAVSKSLEPRQTNADSLNQFFRKTIGL